MTKSHHPSQINQYTNQRTKGIEGGSEWETTTYQKEGLSTAARGGRVEDALGAAANDTAPGAAARRAARVKKRVDGDAGSHPTAER